MGIGLAVAVTVPLLLVVAADGIRWIPPAAGGRAPAGRGRRPDPRGEPPGRARSRRAAGNGDGSRCGDRGHAARGRDRRRDATGGQAARRSRRPPATRTQGRPHAQGPATRGKPGHARPTCSPSQTVVVNMIRRPLSLLSTLLLGSLLAPSLPCAGSGAAFAQPAARPAPDPAKLEAQETQAKRACDSGRVQEGVRLLTELLNQTNDGTYIFNLARCHQQNGQLDQALLMFRSYLRRTDVDPAAAARAREYIAVLERPHPAPPPVSAPSPAMAAAPAADGRPALQASATAGAGSPGRALRIGGLVAGGAGLASLAVGIYYARETQRLNEETRNAVDRPRRLVHRTEQEGRNAPSAGNGCSWVPGRPP